MWPALRAGDEAGIDPLEGEPKVGEVVVAKIGSAFVAHRVMSVAGDGVVMRGDNCEADDPKIPLQAIVGVVTEVRRGGRVVSQAWDGGPTKLGRARLAVLKWLHRVRRSLP
jgi:hypothetical protein